MARYKIGRPWFGAAVAILILSWGPDLLARALARWPAGKSPVNSAWRLLLALGGLGKPLIGETVLGQFIDYSTHRCEAQPGDVGDEVTPGTFLGLVPLLLGILAAQPGAVGQSVTRIVVQDEIILRIPVQPRPVMPQIEWVERKGPKCIPTAAIRRALLSGSEEVDFVLANRARIRAELDDDCPALDFYGGFYLQPQDDLQLCARRDAIHSRMGGSCQIDKFKFLQPRLRRP